MTNTRIGLFTCCITQLKGFEPGLHDQRANDVSTEQTLQLYKSYSLKHLPFVFVFRPCQAFFSTVHAYIYL